MDNKEQFLKEFAELCNKYKILITHCHCGSISLEQINDKVGFAIKNNISGSSCGCCSLITVIIEG